MIFLADTFYWIALTNPKDSAYSAPLSVRPDKGYSLTECISMETMRREGVTVVLTNDKHFEQEGFRALFQQDREK